MANTFLRIGNYGFNFDNISYIEYEPDAKKLLVHLIGQEKPLVFEEEQEVGQALKEYLDRMPLLADDKAVQTKRATA